MIDRKRYELIRQKHGKHASWAIWATPAQKAKSNMGDITIFNNESIIPQLRPNLLMVGLNLSRATPEEPFRNFHDSSPRAQDYKIRHAFIGTEFYGAYMTDIIKDFEEKISGNVLQYLRSNKDFELQNVQLFEQEISDLKCSDPLIIAFGNITFDIMNKHFGQKFRIKKVMHYSQQINKENYKTIVWKTLLNKEPA
jgi:hypothetical protein